MPSKTLLPLVLLSLRALAACSTSQDPGDAGVAADVGIGTDASQSADASAADAGSADAGPADAATPDGGNAFQAVLDERCRSYERRAVITVGAPGGPSRYLSASFQDVPDPWVGPPESTDSSCEFHRAWAGLCGGQRACPGDLACDHSGSCVPYPVPVAGFAVTVRGTSGEQRFEEQGGSFPGGGITLQDQILQVSLAGGGLRVESPPMSVPGELGALTATLTGSHDAPEAMDLTWVPPADAAEVLSLTRINHHVGAPTFTECVVPASAGALHIDGAMLAPLAVATGLEFQALQHVRFAAVEVPGGCVEIRFERLQMTQ
ncbi:MAG: hypothetical protein HY901_08400 [Deltaproteobacteria bacterium]|nr:hypothetical protein [Deltaproteobacteria bacterium]